MLSFALLVCVYALFVAAAIGCVIGVGRLVRGTRIDHHLSGRALTCLAWVLPECCVVANGLLSESAYPTVAAAFGSTAGNALVFGLLTMIWPGRGGVGLSNLGGPVASFAVFLLMIFASYAAMAMGAGEGIGLAQVSADAVLLLVFLACLRLATRPGPGEGPPSAGAGPPPSGSRGAIVAPLLMVSVSILVLAYGSRMLVDLTDPWFAPHGGGFHNAHGWRFSVLTVILALALALPDFLLLGPLADVGPAEDAASRLLLSNSGLLVCVAILGFDPGASHYGVQTERSMGHFLLTAGLAATVALLFSSTSNAISTRGRGWIISSLVVVGFVVVAVSGPR